MAIVYSKKMFIQRIRKHVSDGYANDSFAASENELLLYLDQAIAFTIVGQAYAGAKVEGALVMPEAWLITYNLGNPLLDDVKGEWYATLPQPPLSLPLGYSITDVYFADSANGRSQSVNLIRAKRVPYRKNMPLQNGVNGWVENNTIRLQASDNFPLGQQTLFVQMPSARTTDITEPMNMPDDAIQSVFDLVVTELTKRYGIPKDVIKDNLPSGNKSS